jgi:hypothetical protein
MKLKYSKKVALLTLLLTFSSLVGAVPMLIPTGGFLESSAYAGTNNDSTSVFLSGKFGDFKAFSSATTLVLNPETNPFSGQNATASSGAFATIGSMGLNISGQVPGFFDFLFPSFEDGYFGGTAFSRINFTLTESANVKFNWFGDSHIADPVSTATLKNSENDIFLYCLGGPSAIAGDNQGGTCFNNDSGSQDLGSTGSINLNAGAYEVSLSASDVTAAGTRGGGSGTFSLTGIKVVPVPSALWLFASGLVYLFRIRRPHLEFTKYGY